MNITFGMQSVDLPNPIIGNVTRFTSNSIRRITPGGVLKTYKDDDWPVVETFIYDIYRLNKTQRDAFITLINTSVGKEVSITFQGAIRTGYIVTPVNEILTIRDECWYDAHFEFMANIIINIIGDCIPEVDYSDDNLTLENANYYILFAENGDQLFAENDEPLYIEAY